MKKQKKGFVLAEATLAEVNKQLKVNLFVILVVGFVLGSNILHFMREKSVFYGVLIAAMVVALFFVIKSRQVLKLKQQELIK
ncbi:hypothetical protein JCM18902_785 [Psychrobacter sp. JCM 18902]|uniref:hypothetical protein n=1 Tax=Psychrobacter sp. JCM 18902 TaxID=1298607 RepID=UPI000435C26C|nr:hypothetical protein [Psychrobacter sp. JCM 18902]GAF58024.1 hypothetical protein JCM18902_785 [Psychrobacter sp. JCM 18902]